MLADQLQEAFRTRFAVKRDYLRVLKFAPAKKVDPKFVNVLRWEESQHPRDKEGQFARSAIDQQRRDFMALVRRGEREEVHLDRMRKELADAWTVWSEDTKNRKRPLKPDGAAAKKLDSYKKAKALEEAFHTRYEAASARHRARKQQALEMLKVPPDQRSKVRFEDNPQAPLHPAVAAHARKALEVFRQFDGSGSFNPLTFPADKVDQFKEIFGHIDLEKNADGTYSVPEKLRLGRAADGRANATMGAVNIAGGRDLEGQVFHEVAHHIEFKNSAILKAAVAFREARAHTPREEFKLYEQNHALGPDEIAVRGDFPDPYTGKLYPHDIATEIVSTGVEAYMNDPITFARDRHEHFTLIFDILHGKYRHT